MVSHCSSAQSQMEQYINEMRYYTDFKKLEDELEWVKTARCHQMTDCDSLLLYRVCCACEFFSILTWKMHPACIQLWALLSAVFLW